MAKGVSADVTAIYLRDMYKAEFEGYEELPKVHDQVFKVVPAKKASGDKETQLLSLGRLNRHTNEFEKIIFESPVVGWEFLSRYHLFTKGVSISKEAQDDSTKLGDVLKTFARTWGRMVSVEKEEFGARHFNQGGKLTGDDYTLDGSHTGNTDSSGDLAYDSFPLFNLTGNARSSKGGGTYFNSTASLSLTVDNFETTYHLATTTNAFDEQDERIAFDVDTLLTQSGAEYNKGRRIIETEGGLPGGQLNDINPNYKLVEVMKWRYLTDGAGTFPAFFVGKRRHADWEWHDR